MLFFVCDLSFFFFFQTEIVGKKGKEMLSRKRLENVKIVEEEKVLTVLVCFCEQW